MKGISTALRSRCTARTVWSLPTRAYAKSAVEITSRGLRIGSSLISFPRLRDACQCSSCVHPTTGQKLHTSGEALVDAKRSSPAVRSGQTGFDIDWDSHSSHYPWQQVNELATAPEAPSWGTRHLWDANVQIPNFEYRSLKGELPKLLSNLHSIAIVLIRNDPVENTNNEDCTLREIATSIGQIRNTFYGELWDVKSVKQSRNVAYTDLDLGLHMDLLYFSSPPRFQALHCLRNRVRGGESYLVDAFRALEIYRTTHQRSADLLNDIGIEYQYDNDGHSLRFRHPLSSDDMSDLHAAVNWSPPFQAQVTRGEDDYYQALYEFERILARPSLRCEFLLQEGDVMLFDNRRVLHARRAFEDESGDSGPNRWLKGCYLDGEVVWDKLAVLNRP